MGSVVASWTGRCLDRERQEDLCRRIEPLAVLSHSYLDEAPPIRRYDHALEGTILVSNRIFRDAPSRVPTIDEPPDPAVPPFELRVAGRPQAPELRLTEAFAVSKAAVFGTAFRLYDGRNLYPGEDEVSLVVATCDELPELTGQLVEVHDRADCLTSGNETVRAADSVSDSAPDPPSVLPRGMVGPPLRVDQVLSHTRPRVLEVRDQSRLRPTGRGLRGEPTPVPGRRCLRRIGRSVSGRSRPVE